MRKPINITTPMPTLKEVAAISNIPPARLKEIAELARRLSASDSASADKSLKSQPKVAAKRKTAKKAG